jgi:hypothetical protein
MTTFEVRVEVERKGSERYREISWFGNIHIRKPFYMYVGNKVTKMFHKDARTPEQAMKKCEKYGRPLSVRKADVSRMDGNMENLPLLQELYQPDNPYKNAVAMDELIWRKRVKRLDNRKKDRKKT